MSSSRLCIFFFQAEDGIRDFHVTGVQTCALPIWASLPLIRSRLQKPAVILLLQPNDKLALHLGVHSLCRGGLPDAIAIHRSEERRVGKECRSRWARSDSKKRRRDSEEVAEDMMKG